MWRKNDGFFLAEALLSLSAWLIATTTLFPLSLFLIGQSIDLTHETDAMHLLYERLQELKVENERVDTDPVSKNGIVYNYKMVQHENGGMMEVCVEFDSYFSKKISKCAYAE